MIPTPEDTPLATLDEFADVEDARRRLGEVGYLADSRLATTVFLQSRLGKPVLLEGPAGVGKTQLALSLARATGRRLLRLQCYEGQDETKALYEWDYGKQLLYTQILREKIGQLVADTKDLEEAVDRIAQQESVFFSERFLAPRPLLQAIDSDEPVVLLIDEVDRADEALEAVLLECLAEFQISIPEIGTVKAKHQPFVILTSNNSRDLSAALKRRCLHLFLDYPTPERELEILRSKDTGLADSLAVRLVEVVRGLRELELRKAPSISETIDWARTLAVLGVSELRSDILSETLNVVVKYERDAAKANLALPRLLDPNATVPDSRASARGHGHSHGGGPAHDHGDGAPHSHDDPSSAPAPTGAPAAARRDTTDDAVSGDVDGPAVRAAKDRPGRHDGAYYGAKGSGGKRDVPRSQGERSFAARSARRRPV